MPQTKARCVWSQHDELMQQYHDQDWGVPLTDSRALWELLMLEGFQAGLSWSIVLRKREAFQAAFKGFEPAAVARFTERDIDRLVGDPRIIRARSKIVATIEGAKIFVKMQNEGQNFAELAWDMIGGKAIQNTGSVPVSTPLSEKVSRELRSRGFKFCGPTICYAWMQAAGMVNDHSPGCFRREPCARKKVAKFT